MIYVSICFFQCIESILSKVDYDHDKVNQWTAAIVEQSLTHLVKLGKTYKYIGKFQSAVLMLII